MNSADESSLFDTTLRKVIYVKRRKSDGNNFMILIAAGDKHGASEVWQ